MKTIPSREEWGIIIRQVYLQIRKTMPVIVPSLQILEVEARVKEKMVRLT